MAFRVLERDTIPCRIRTDLKPFDENILNLTENIKRKDLNMLQEARGILALEKAGWNEETIANRVGMSRGWVQVRLMLLRLPLDIQAEVGAGIINQTQVRQLYMLRDRKDEMYAIARKIKDLRASGESAKITIPKKPNPYRKELRTPTEMFDFQDIIQKVIGNNFATKCIGWCAGANNDYEIHRALLEEASKMGITYTIPQEILERF
jgi:ParB-like chromosome segregation protein Spo0J